MKKLKEAGCEMRLLKPPAKGWSRCHTKTLIFDQECVMTGSVNLTCNGFSKNKEHLVRLVGRRVVEKFCLDFQADWATLPAVSDADIEEMMKNWTNKQAKSRSEGDVQSRSESRPRGRSGSGSRNPCVTRSVSRNLSQELSSVDERTEEQ